MEDKTQKALAALEELAALTVSSGRYGEHRERISEAHPGLIDDIRDALQGEPSNHTSAQDGHPRKGDTIALAYTDPYLRQPVTVYMRALRDFDPAEEARRFRDGEGLEKIRYLPDTNEALFIAWATSTGLLETTPGPGLNARTWVIDPLITPASDLAERYATEETGLELLGAVDDIDGKISASVLISAHQVRYIVNDDTVAYPAHTIEGLQPGTKYWILSDEGARRDAPNHYRAATSVEEVIALQGHRLLGTITTPN